MNRGMNGLARQDFKIQRVVIQFVPINMVDDFARQQGATKHSFGYDTVGVPPLCLRVGFASAACLHLLGANHSALAPFTNLVAAI
jgi:hypothetical protein